MAEPKQLKAIKGGLNITKRLLADSEEAGLTAAQRAEAGRKAAELIKSQPQVKASEALGQLMEKGFKKTTTTQADRTRVGGGNIGGAPFPAISEADPAYKGKVWGVMDEGTAARLKNLTDPETAWTTMLGSANQLKTNPIVFDKLKRGFVDSMKQGNLSDELASKINHNLALTFGEGADIRDPKIWRQADTFEKRAALADVMMGQGTAPSKGGVAIGGEKSGKGVIFKPTDILKRETEPSLLHTEHGGDVPTFAAGPRLFRLNKESVYDPTLHPGFPTLLTGEDLKINMKPTPTEVYLRDWHQKFKKDNPERKGPGYYDLALGVKGEGLPSQDLHDEYIRHLIREGFKKGGAVDINAADSRLAQAMEKHMAKGGGVDIKAADARLEAAMNARMGMADGGEVGFKKIQFMNKGGKLVKGVANVGKRLLQDAPLAPKVKPPSDNVANVRQSNFRYPKTVGNQTVAIDKLSGGVRMSDPNEVKRVKALADQIASPEGYISRIIVDHNDNVIEGQHRLEALRQLGIKDVPVYKIEEMADTMPVDQMKSAVQGVGAIHPDHVGQIINHALESIASEGVEGARQMDLGRFQKHYDAALNAVTSDVKKAEGGGAFKKLQFMDKGGKVGKVASGVSKVGKRLLADPEKKIIESPSIIIPSKVSNVKEAVRQSKGDFGARRVERAADEIPNLERLYKEEALKEAFTGDNAKALMTMNPADFEKYATPLVERARHWGSKGESDTDKFNLPTADYIKYLRTIGPFDDVPFLEINKQEQGLPLMPFISGHEGRHRSRALASQGEKSGLVQLLPRAELREPFPRRSQEEYIDALKQELEMTKNLVDPQEYWSSDVFAKNPRVRLPTTKLPDIYAKGGLTMAGGGSIQDNLKNIQNYSVLDQGAPRKPNELGGVILSGASWMAGDEKTRLAKQLFGEDVTNTAIGGQKTSDVLNQLNAFERDGGTFQKGATVVLDIGANDIAQGVDKATIRKNLDEIVSRLGDSGVNVILSGQPEANSYEEAINSTTLQMDDLYNDIASKHPNVTLVDAMSGMLNQKDLMDESGFHLNSDDAKLAYLSQFANAYKGANNQSETGIPKQVTQTDNVVDIPQEIAQITQASVPETSYTPEVTYTPEVVSTPTVVSAPAVIESQPSAGYTYAQNNSSIDNYYNVINDYLAQERTQDEIQAAMEQYGVSQADVDAARGYQPSGGGKAIEQYATEQYADGGAMRAPSKKTEGFQEEKPRDKSVLEKMHQVIQDMPKVPTSPLGMALNAGYSGYKYFSGKDPVGDFQRELNRKMNRPIDTGSAPPVDGFAEGGSAFKTLQFNEPQHFDGGGIASPEEVNPFEGSRREPLLTKKDLENIKRNAPEVYEWAKQNVKDEASQLRSAKGAKDFALRVGASYAGAIPDFANLLLMAPDAVFGTELASEKPWFGSAQYIDAMNKAGILGENEFPIAETVAGILSPASLVKKGIKKMRGVRSEPKKRRGGLAAMSR